MNIQCPVCQTVFRVDPEKIPTSGVRARCASCQTVFRLDRSGASSAGQPALATAGAEGQSTGSRAEVQARPLPTGTAAVATPAAPAPTPAPRRPSFLNQDPEARARRIARALVSDIVAYNKDKLMESMAAGTVRNDFREEIRKSWEEYVEQVGLELAKKTPFFRDALNDILAKGQKVF